MPLSRQVGQASMSAASAIRMAILLSWENMRLAVAGTIGARNASTPLIFERLKMGYIELLPFMRWFVSARRRASLSRELLDHCNTSSVRKSSRDYVLHRFLPSPP